ncbi:MAG TPA: M4 family metallopeptidase [Vicinamibacterales bacterium]|jgi:thermolysin|nr:M4 family metallopeptidase [Vicinamibacterales bacterium]
MHLRSLIAVTVCAALASVLVWIPLRAQARRVSPRINPSSVTELRAEDGRVTQMLRQGALRVRDSRPDKLVPGRRIERVDQYHRGVRVFGADVARQLSGGQVISMLGTMYDDIAISTDPALGEADAHRVVEARTGVTLGAARTGELVVFPRAPGDYVLTWRIRASAAGDLREYFVDARSGAMVFEYSDLQAQSAVGRATGVLGDSKKISVTRFGGAFTLADALRPPSIRTYDMKGDPFRTRDVINGRVALAQSDMGADVDNNWEDAALGDAHIYSGYTYDYYYKRFNRRGLDDANRRMQTLVHPVKRSDFSLWFPTFPEFFTNAVYYGDGLMLYGEGLPAGLTAGGQTWDFTAGALDIVAHEITHGVTEFTSDLIYMNESGALNESFSDIIGSSVEAFFQPAGNGTQRSDYLIAEDVVRGSRNGIRSMADPRAYGDADHYSVRFTGTEDGGGVHTNSGIPNHVFYLAVEGGTNRVSGLAVQGVGGANRVQIETVFYRAVTQLLPSNATFAMARAATIQAARDLYGAGSAAERAMIAAWTAVGVN